MPHATASPPRPRTFPPSAVLAATLLGLAATLCLAAAGFAAAAPAADAAATPLRTWRLPTSLPFQPADVAILPDGRLAIADAATRAVLLYDHAGAPVGTWRAPEFAQTPLAVAGNPLDGSGVVVWARLRGARGYDPLEGDKPDLGSLSVNAYVQRIASDGATMVRLSSGSDPLVDLAVRPLDGRALVYGARISPDDPWLIASYVPADGPGQPRIAVWRNHWMGFTQANGQPFEVFEPAVANGGGRLVARLRQTIPFAGADPIAVAASADLRFHVLVRPARGAPTAGDAPHVRIVGAELTEMGAVRFEDAPKWPAGGWPWAIDVGEDGDYAVSTADDLFAVARYDAAGHLRYRLTGGRVATRLALTSAAEGARSPSAWVAAVAAGDLGRPIAVERTAVNLLALEPTGDTAMWRAGTPALDVATSGGAVYTVDERGRVRRFGAAGVPEAGWPAVTVPGGARIAAAGDRVYVAQPISRTVVVLDATSGAVIARRTRPEPSAGVWPDDVAATSDGLSYAVDAARGTLAVIAPSGAVSATWPVGLAAAPRFLAVADIPGGRVAVVATDDGAIERYDAATGSLVDRWRPADADGNAYVPGDVAVGPDGTIYLTQAERGAVHAYAPLPAPLETPAGAATPTPGPLACRVAGTKGAAPRRVVLGHAVEVSITLRAACPGASRFEGADVLLVVDRSGSMAPGGKIDTAKAVAVRLARAFADAPHRVGLVTFAGDARLDAPLAAGWDVGSPPPAAALAAILSAMPAEGTTDLAAALELAHATLGAARRPKAIPLAVVISDGRSDTSATADALAADGILVASVIVGDDADRYGLESIAAAADLVFDAGAPGAAAAIHRRLLTTIYGAVAGDWAIDDALGAQVELVANSPLPAAGRSDDRLLWARPILPPGGITLTYRVRPLAPGRINTNRFAWADYTDADGARRRYVLPIPVVDVITPTPSPTPTATATPVPPRVYLPIALNERCRPTTSPVDAVLVLDASTSMLERIADGRTKLDAARGAIGTFLDQLRLTSGDRAAIIAFHNAAVVAAPLTADRGRLDRALSAIATDRQTCLPCGIDAASGVLDAAGRRAERRAMMIVLTDGRSNPRPAGDAVASAARAKAAGITIYTIGLGADLDVEALAAIASTPRSFIRAADAAALDAIYRDIAKTIPCPASAFWSAR